MRPAPAIELAHGEKTHEHPDECANNQGPSERRSANHRQASIPRQRARLWRLNGRYLATRDAQVLMAARSRAIRHHPLISRTGAFATVLDDRRWTALV